MEEEDVSALFSSKPRTFKMERGSPQASQLKASVLNKLLDFLDNYTDDDLAEYIVVLVCNGKNQNQTRKDLEEFLGDASGRFVTWLWNHLSDEVYLPKSFKTHSVLKTDSKAAYVNDADKGHKTIKEIQLQANYPLSNPENQDISNFSSPSTFSNSAKVSEDLKFPGHGGDAVSIGVDFKESYKHATQIQRTSDIADYNVNQAKGTIRSEVRSFHEIPAVDMQGQSFEDGNKKMGKVHNEASQHQRFSPKKEFASRNFRSITTGISNESRPLSMNAAGGKLLSNIADSVLCENNQSRRSVWDRLGKPSDGCDVKFDAGIQSHATSTIKRKMAGSTEDLLEECRPESLDLGSKQVSKVVGQIAGSVKTCMKVLPQRQADEVQLAGNDVSIIKSVNDAINLKRRRLPIEVNNDSSLCLSDHENKVFILNEYHKNLQRKLSTRLNSSQSVKESFPVPGSANCSSKFTNTASNIASSKRPDSAAIPPVKTLVSHANSLTAKSESIDSEAGNANNRPVKTGIQDLNLQLHQVAKEILELRSKHAQIFRDAKQTILLGPQNHQEDVDSRTAFVTNVHFAASRESLSLHFSKCGPVAKVTILTDTHTGHPKGFAYVTFASKDSIEKAIMLNGTSFMSRTLKVMPKADMPEGVLDSSHSSVKSPQTWHHPLQWKAPLQRKHSGSHLQWKREQQGSGETSAS